MSTGPTTGELADFIMENLPTGYSLKITFSGWGVLTVSLYDRIRQVVQTWDDNPEDLPAVVVLLVNRARGMANLGSVEGTWDQR